MHKLWMIGVEGLYKLCTKARLYTKCLFYKLAWVETPRFVNNLCALFPLTSHNQFQGIYLLKMFIPRFHIVYRKNNKLNN